MTLLEHQSGNDSHDMMLTRKQCPRGVELDLAAAMAVDRACCNDGTRVDGHTHTVASNWEDDGGGSAARCRSQALRDHCSRRGKTRVLSTNDNVRGTDKIVLPLQHKHGDA